MTKEELIEKSLIEDILVKYFGQSKLNAISEIHEYYSKLIELVKQENLALRRLLWYHHGCEQMFLYGDDGELQCNNLPKHLIDFKRMKPSEIEYWLMNEEGRLFIDHLKKSNPSGG